MADVRADGVAIYVFRRRGRAIEFLQLRRSHTTGEYQHSWQTVYGGIRAKETAVAAAFRELREETGLAPPDLRDVFQVEYIESFYFRPKDYVLMMPVFAAEVRPAATITLNHEHDAFRWVKATQIARHFMWRTQRQALAAALEEIRRPSAARGFLTIPIPRAKRVGPPPPKADR